MTPGSHGSLPTQCSETNCGATDPAFVSVSQDASFELAHHRAAELEVIEKQIKEEVFPAHLQRHLASHIGEAGAKLQQEARDVLHQGVFDGTFLSLFSQAAAKGTRSGMVSVDAPGPGPKRASDPSSDDA